MNKVTITRNDASLLLATAIRERDFLKDECRGMAEGSIVRKIISAHIARINAMLYRLDETLKSSEGISSQTQPG